MGIFGNTNQSALESEIEKATSEKNISEKWSTIMDICDKVGNSSANAKESLRIIIKRLNHSDPHVVIQAITLLDACVNNCGKNYHLEIASREFEQEFRKLISKNQGAISTKLKACLKKWAEGDFKSDPQLNLIPSLYMKMKQEGHDFSDIQTTPKREVALSKDPNVVSSQQEEDDIAKAIELSLQEKSSQPKTVATSSLYPSVNVAPTTTAASEQRKVRALYDFEAAEDNELTFKAGEIIMVIEESDPNWWKGSNHRGEGYFPANFVTADLSAEPGDTTKDLKSNKKNVQFSKNSYENEKVEQQIDINEDAIDRLLFLLHEADPSEPSQDSDEMLRLENAVNQMGPLIDAELERVDRKHAQLTQLSSDLIDTINLYHSLMRETEKMPLGVPYGLPQANSYAPGNYQMPPIHMNSPAGQQMSQVPPNFGLMANARNFPPPSLNQMPMQNTFFHDANAPTSFTPVSHQQNPGQEQQVNANAGYKVPPGSEIPPQYLPNSGNNFPAMPPQLQQNSNFPHPNFPTNTNVPAYCNPQQSQLNQMMGNLGLQSGHIPLQQQQQQQQQIAPTLQLTQPMTYLQQQNNPGSHISYQKR